MTRTRTVGLGPAARPVAVPSDIDEPARAKASGRFELPLHIRWSGSSITYDLDDRSDRARVYEQVLRGGTEDDVRFYIDSDLLLGLWDETRAAAVGSEGVGGLDCQPSRRVVLSPLQEQVAAIVAGLAEAAALIARVVSASS